MVDAPQNIDLAVNRRVWFDSTFSFVGNFTGATFKMQVREVRDTTGTPLLSLTNAAAGSTGIALLYAGTDTVANHVTAGRLDASVYTQKNPSTGVLFVATDSLRLSQLRVTVQDLTGLPFPEERGEDLECEYDLIGYGGSPDLGFPAVLMTGKFILLAAATIP